MKTNDIVLITGNNGFFGQTRKPWVSMNSDLIRQTLEEEGFKARILSYHQAINMQEKISDSIVFYSFNQKVNRRTYLKDLVSYLNDGTNTLIPSYDLLLCHEDKGYQELYKRKIGLESLNSFYFSRIDEVDHYPVQYPMVLKTVDGSNGKGVFLVHSREELDRVYTKLAPQNFLRELDLIRRKYFRKKKAYPLYPSYSNRTDYIQYKDYVHNEVNFILQEFIPGLSFDYRVLILFDKYYVVKRYTRENDFRASGAKKFEIHFEVNPELLTFAQGIHQKMDSPFLSLDIVHDGKYYHLLEFQAIHFGLNPFHKPKGYFTFSGARWEFTEEPERPVIEKQIALGLSKYIRVKT